MLYVCNFIAGIRAGSGSTWVFKDWGQIVLLSPMWLYPSVGLVVEGLGRMVRETLGDSSLAPPSTDPGSGQGQ
jgi:hypothetical protein